MKIGTFILIAGILSTGLNVFAQEQAKGKDNKFEHLMEQLEVTEDQRTEIEAIRAETKSSVKTIKENTEISEGDKRTRIKELKSTQKDQFTAVLTEEQQAKLKALKAEHKENKKKKPEEIAQSKTDKIAEIVELSDSQKERVNDLNLKTVTKAIALKKDESLGDAERKEGLKTNKENHKTMMKSILDEEQFSIYEAQLSAMKEAKSNEHKKCKKECKTSNE